MRLRSSAPSQQEAADELTQVCSVLSMSRNAAPPFLMRSRAKAIRVNGRVLSISFQGETLLSQLTLVGGNKTGVFVHQVTEGSPAHTVGISPGAQVVEVGLFSAPTSPPVRRRLFQRCCPTGEVRAEPEVSEDDAGGLHLGGGHVGSGSDHGPLPSLPPAPAGWYVLRTGLL